MTMNPRVVEVKEQIKGKRARCDFCHKSTIDPLMLGPMYKLSDVTVHYFCLLFSAGLSQNGEDAEGILGFLAKDIKKELKRGSKLKCKYCKDTQATVGCSLKSCKMSFHYPCGLEEGALYQFIDNYESYCIKHRTLPIIPPPNESWACPICYCTFENEKYPIKPPCCNNNSVFHRKCIMQAASKSGLHFFKCPLCNDKETFGRAMRLHGIYLPDRDAEWELEPNAFEELNQQYNRCDKQPCLCPSGREFSGEDGENTDWKVIRCGGCGAAGVHMKCEGLTVFTYRCETCTPVLFGTSLDRSIDEDSSQRSRMSEVSRTPRIRHRLIPDSDGEEADEPVHNILDSLHSLMPRIEDESDSESSTSTESASTSSASFATSDSRSTSIPALPEKQNVIVYDKTLNAKYKLVRPIDLLSEQEDDDEDSYDFVEPEADFLSSSKNMSGGHEFEEERCQKNDTRGVRTGLVKVSQNRSDLINIVAKIKDLITVPPSNDRTLQKQYPLPVMPTDNNNTTTTLTSEETLRKIKDIIAQELHSVIDQVTSENPESKNKTNMDQVSNTNARDDAHCSHSTPKASRKESKRKNPSKTILGETGGERLPSDKGKTVQAVRVASEPEITTKPIKYRIPKYPTPVNSVNPPNKFFEDPKITAKPPNKSPPIVRLQGSKITVKPSCKSPPIVYSNDSITATNPRNKPSPTVLLQNPKTTSKPTKSVFHQFSPSSSPSKPHQRSASNTNKPTQSKLDNWLSPTQNLSIPAAANIVKNPFSSGRNISVSPEFSRDSISIPNKSPTLCSPITTNVQRDDEANSSRKFSSANITTDDDDDDCMVVDVLPSSSKPNGLLASIRANENIITIDDNDDLKIEAAKLVTDSRNIPPIKKENSGIQWQNTAIAYNYLSHPSNDPRTKERKYYNGTCAIGLSVALIANSTGLVNSRKKVETKTNSGSGLPEIVILDSDDDEESSKINPNTPIVLRTKSEGDEKPSENDTMPIPNRDRDLQSSMPKRVRGISQCEETANADMEVADSKKPRVSSPKLD